MNPVIVCIAKLEQDYIEEFVRYHLAIGFNKIYIYDNEDVPTYEKLLEKYLNNINVIHLPFNNYCKGVQYIALDHFIKNYMYKDGITHIAHIDIDEFIVLKKHNNITEFINEYIKDDCAGIGMNWRFFGSSGHTEKSNIPTTIRFTMCEEKGNMHIKTLFNVNHFVSYIECHSIRTKPNFHIKSTNGSIIVGPFNKNIVFDVIQLNHYKSKTYPEFKYMKTRGRADLQNKSQSNNTANEDELQFSLFDKNEIEDLYAYNFFKKILI